MKAKKILTIISALSIITTICSSISNPLPSRALTSMEAVSSRNISEYTMQDPSHQIQGYDSDLAMDKDGNKIMVWKNVSYDQNNNMECYSIKFQKFNISDIPLTPITTAREYCQNLSNGSSSEDYVNPSAAMDDHGNTILTWVKINKNLNPVSATIEAAIFTKENNNSEIFTVNEDIANFYTGIINQVAFDQSMVNESLLKSYKYAQNLRPHIVIDKNSPEAETNYAISWYNCADTVNYCNSPTYDAAIYLKIFSTDFTSLNPTHNTISTNKITSETSQDYYPIGQTPGLSFSGESYLVTWDGYDSTNSASWNQAVYGRLIKNDGTLLNNNFRISELNTESHESTVAGANRNFSDSLTATNISGVYYVAWTADNNQNSHRDIYMKKILCNGQNNCQSSTHQSYSNKVLQEEPITVKVNLNSSHLIFQPKLEISQNRNDTRRNYNQENTANDFLSINWFELDTSDTSLIYYNQNYNKNLARLGTQYKIDSYNYSQINIGGNLLINQDTNNTSLSVAFLIITTLHPSLTINQDGLYSMIYATPDYLQIRTYNRDQFKIGEENIVHASDRENAQSSPAVATNSNGYSVVVHQSSNNTDNDIIYSLYDDNGIAILNSSFAAPNNDGDQIEPTVAFFQDEPTSANYGKFIIAWDANGEQSPYGIYFRIFNSDGTPDGTQSLIDESNTNDRRSPELSTGIFPVFAVAYHESDGTQEMAKVYISKNNIVLNSVGLETNSLISNPKIFLNPKANNNTSDYLEFVLAYETNNESSATQIQVKECHADLYTNVYTDNSFSINGKSADIKGTYLENLTSLNNALPGNTARNPIYYAISYIDNSDNQTKVKSYTFNQGELTSPVTISGEEKQSNLETALAVDPQTGNILVTWTSLYDFSSLWKTNQIILPENAHTITNNDYLFNLDHSELLKVKSTSGYPDYITLDQAASRPPTGTPGTNSYLKLDLLNPEADNTINNYAEQVIYFNSNNNSLSPKVGQTLFVISDSTTIPSGKIISIDTQNNLFITTITYPNTNINQRKMILATATTGAADNIIQLDHANGENTYFNGQSPYNDFPYQIGQKILGFSSNYGNLETYNATGTITGINPTNGTVTYSQDSNDIGDFANTNYITTYSEKITNNTSPSISEINGQYLKLRKADDNSSAFLDLFGPNILVNKYPLYNETVDHPALSFEGRNSNEDKKYALVTYSTNASPESPYIDPTGIYRQFFTDPFSTGTSASLISSAVQQVNPGGKYIIVPPLIDFGNISKGEVATAKFRDITGAAGIGKMEIADLDGTPFDLTVTMSDLTNSDPIGGTIPKNKIAIFNNDENPNTDKVTTEYAFSNTNDIELDPSSDPQATEQEVTSFLDNSVTLLKKTNANTGIYDIYPMVVLYSEPTINPGIYSGTMTFTLN